MANSERHNAGLQSIRGLAALTVLLHHASYLYQVSPGQRLFIDAIVNAHAAIIVFFVLSGFVLANSFMRTDSSINAATSFYVKRAFRILPGLWVATALCAGYIVFFNTRMIEGISEWGKTMMAPPLWTGKVFLVALIGFPNILRPAYTILVEIIGSAVIPPMVSLFTHKKIFATVTIVILAGFSYWMYALGGNLKYFMFLVHFALGVYAAVFLSENPDFKIGQTAAFTCFLGLLFSRLIVMTVYTSAPQPLVYQYHFPTSALLEGIFSTGLILAVASNASLFSLLRQPWLAWIGDVSYGIYLLHLPSLYLSAQIVGILGIEAPLLRFATVLTLTVAITLSAATVLYAYIELPFIELGKKVASWIRLMFGVRAQC